VALELVGGSRNRPELNRALRFVAALDVVWPTEEDGAKAYELLAMYRLSTGMSLFDFVIAAMCINRDAKLFTFNLKHYLAVDGLAVESPYLRLG
jgi:predicted nucleic acid-binding protein